LLYRGIFPYKLLGKFFGLFLLGKIGHFPAINFSIFHSQEIFVWACVVVFGRKFVHLATVKIRGKHSSGSLRLLDHSFQVALTLIFLQRLLGFFVSIDRY
jgi:hypothetical protein